MINDQVAFKSQLLESCHTLLQERIDQLSTDMKAIQDAANEETKSSAGDKYETGRAMAMLEKEKLASQYNAVEKQLQSIAQLKPSTKLIAEAGAIIFTKQAIYFLSTSIGQIVINDKAVFCISPVAPIARAMSGKKAGESFDWNGRKFEIINLF